MANDAGTRRASTGWLLVAGGAALLSGLWLGRALPPAERAPAIAPSIAPVQVADDQTSASAEARTLATLPPRPPADAPLAEAWPLLEARALAGDAVAACRLAEGLARCRWYATAAARVGTRPARVDGRDLALRSAVDAARRDCADLPPSLGITRGAAMQLAAARAGHGPSAVAFLTMQAVGGYEAFRADAEPSLRLYEAQRGPLLLERLEAGSLEAAVLLYLEDMAVDHAPALRLDDAERAALRSLLGEHGVLRAHPMPAEPGPRALRWADALQPDAAERSRAIALLDADAGTATFASDAEMAAQLARSVDPGCEVLP